MVLAGGYGRRLWPLTRDKPKSLLMVAGRPILDYVMDKVLELEEVDEIILSTNLRFKSQFEEWLRARSYENVRVVADRSMREEEKPGAVRALAEISLDINDDLLVVAGDNLFTSSLRGMLDFFRAKSATVVALYDVRNKEIVKECSAVEIDEDNKIISFVEKPGSPKTTLLATCIYMLPSQVLPRLSEYVEKGENPDQAGRFIEWLHKREPIYGFMLGGRWYDIGTIDRYMKACREFEKLVGHY